MNNEDTIEKLVNITDKLRYNIYKLEADFHRYSKAMNYLVIIAFITGIIFGIIIVKIFN